MKAWWTLAIVVLIESASMFGRSSAVSPFLNAIHQDLSLSVTQISGAYSLGHLAASFLLPYIGRWYDKTSLCGFMRFFVLLFAGTWMLFGAGLIQLANQSYLCLGALGGCFIIIRLCIQTFHLVDSAVLASEFDKYKKLAIGCSAIASALVGASCPYICYSISQHINWQRAAFGLGTLWLVFLIPAGWLIKTRERVSAQPVKMDNPSKQGILFYTVLFALGFKHFQESGIAFHLVPICTELGINIRYMLMGMFIMTCVSLGITFFAGHIFSRWGWKTTLVLFSLTDIGMLYGIHSIHQLGILPVLVVCTGLYWGISTILPPLVLPKMFSDKKLGALQGMAYSFMSLGSGLGPFYFGWIKDVSSYQTGLRICIGVALLMPLVFLYLKPTKSNTNG
ncbi:MAG: hypothetical protein MJ218_02745 [Opitutales bacterium]|nr:hypothetical protein [Opitutales bacterium]